MDEKVYLVNVVDDQGTVIFTEEVYLMDTGEEINEYGVKPKTGRTAIMAASDAVYFG